MLKTKKGTKALRRERLQFDKPPPGFQESPIISCLGKRNAAFSNLDSFLSRDSGKLQLHKVIAESIALRLFFLKSCRRSQAASVIH